MINDKGDGFYYDDQNQKNGVCDKSDIYKIIRLTGIK